MRFYAQHSLHLFDATQADVDTQLAVAALLARQAPERDATRETETYCAKSEATHTEVYVYVHSREAVAA